MNMSMLRHACYMLGKNTEESLQLVKGYEEAEDKFIYTILSLSKATDQNKIKYVTNLLKPTLSSEQEKI